SSRTPEPREVPPRDAGIDSADAGLLTGGPCRRFTPCGTVVARYRFRIGRALDEMKRLRDTTSTIVAILLAAFFAGCSDSTGTAPHLGVYDMQTFVGEDLPA